MATPEGYTVLVFNSIPLIIARREFNQRTRQLQRERRVKILLVVMMISLRVFQPFK